MKITLNGTTQNLYDLCHAVEGNFPPNCANLQLTADTANNAAGVEVGGANMDGTGLGRTRGPILPEASTWWTEDINIVSTRDKWVRGTNNDVLYVDHTRA